MLFRSAPVMKKKEYIIHPVKWVIKNKIRSIRGLDACIDKQCYNVGQDPSQGDLRDKF